MNKNLVAQLRNLGFPLFELEKTFDVNETLAEVVKSKDTRLWEGFPVLLSNANKRELFSYNTVRNRLKHNKPDLDSFSQLVDLSLALYRYLRLKFWWADQLYEKLPVSDRKKTKEFLDKLKETGEVTVTKKKMSFERLKEVFNNYFSEKEEQYNGLQSRHEELYLEYALSQLFSARQKDLVLKKLRSEKLTKTEREYFSRVVKKKLMALANPELQKAAKKILQF